MHAVPANVKKAKAQTAILHCDVIGDPEPELQWNKDGVVLQETDRIAFQRKKRTLVIRLLVEEDSGVYKCIARNTAGDVAATTKMSVFGMCIYLMNFIKRTIMKQTYGKISTNKRQISI